MRVSEIFYSIQGEGVNIGKPAVFIRLAHCNLKCSWCDTPYTWNFGNGEKNQYGKTFNIHQETRDMNDVEIEKEIKRYPAAKHIVLTGGEPLIQQRQLTVLAGRLEDKFNLEIETNGTIIPNSDLVRSIDYWSVSPKLGNSGNSQRKMEIPQVYQFFSLLNNAFFKYVISFSQDLVEVKQLIEKYKIPKERVLVMPEGNSRSEIDKKLKFLGEICKREGLRLTTRLQIQMFGDKRGT